MTDRRDQRGPMSTERWRRVRDVFADAIECDVAVRAQRLGDRCGSDHDLRREVESLLASHDRSGLVDRLGPAIAPATAWARTQVAAWEGRRVGQYRVLELVGAGGMGVVYKAQDTRLERHVALKFLPPHLSLEAAAKERFLVEARAAAALDHPNICTILQIGETGDGQLFLAMPFYDGETVAARLKRGRLRFDEALRIAVQIARGLGVAHARGVVHRDIKPSNVMLLRDGSVKILDFGIATIEDPSSAGAPGSAAAEARFGTLAYMSPEHVRGDAVDHRSDIWSLGVLLHEMLTGVRPFDGYDRLADAILNQDPDLIATSYPDVPIALERMIRRALAKLPDDRYPSTPAFVTDLLTLAAGADGAALAERARSAVIPEAPDAGPPTERRRVAVLVTLVSDYTNLVERMTPAEAHRLLARIRDIAVDVVRRHGGLVNQAIGEEIVSVFGVPAAHDDDELRAVRAGLELHACVRQMTAGPGSAVQIQSGLHAGSIVTQELDEGPRRYALVGAPANVASRLAALAPAGEVVLSSECERLLSPFVHTVACAPVVLEPGAPPVTPCRVVGQTGLETRLEASEQAGLTPYVGRESDLALLQRHVEAAGRGDGCVIDVVGDPGVGKSRLVYELRQRSSASAARGHVLALQGRCRAFGDVSPYGPFIDIVRGVLHIRKGTAVESQDLVAQFRALDPSLEPFLPLYLHLLSVTSESHPLPRHLQGEHLQAALVDALAALFTVLSGSATVMVVLEDWHWADSASRAVLARMREIVSTARLVFIVTMRPGSVVLERVTAHGARLALEPLDFAASAAIIGAALGAASVADQFARDVFERTGGNPFFLEQACRALLEQGMVSLREGEAVIEGGPGICSLPNTVQAVIQTRLDNLEPHAREVARVAAVFGREFEYALLADVLGAGIDLAPAIARLSECGLICQAREDSRLAYRFTHALTQEVSYDSLIAHQRRLLHEAIGRAIERHHPERLDQQAALLAHHFSRAEAWREAVQYGRRAANRAFALSQFADAFDTLERVLEWLPHLEDDEDVHRIHAEVLFQQERACETMGLRRQQRQIIGRLIARLAPGGPSAHLAEAYLREGDLLTLLKRFNAADRVLSTALRISRGLSDPRLERNILRSIGLLRWHEGRLDEARLLMESALSISRRLDEDAVAGDLVNLSSVLKGMGDYPAALSRIEEAFAMPSLARNPKTLAYALQVRANLHRGTGNLDATLAWLRRADENAAQLLPIERSFHLTSIAHIELRQGRIEAAIETYQKAIELGRRARHADGLAQALRMAGDLLSEIGRHREALPYALEAAGLFGQFEDAAAEADMWVRVAEAREHIGLHAESLDAWKRVHTLCRGTADMKGQLEALEGVARTTRRIHGAAEVCVSAFEAALDMATALGESRRALVCLNTLGILEWSRDRHAEALTHYETALLIVRELGHRTDEGVILNSLGVMLEKMNRPEEARTVFEESVALNRETAQTLLEAYALAGLGRLARVPGRLDEALARFEQSRELCRVAGDRKAEAAMSQRITEMQTAMCNGAAARGAAATASALK